MFGKVASSEKKIFKISLLSTLLLSTCLVHGGEMQKSEFAIASLILGALSFIQLFGVEKGVVAVIFGIIALSKIEKDKENLSGKGYAIAGVVLGIAMIALTTIFIIRHPGFIQSLLSKK